MKQVILYIGIVFCTARCDNPDFRPATGDLLFQVGKTSEMGGAIEAATGSGSGQNPLRRSVNFTHVAIAVRSGQADSVIEATTDGGVRMTSLPEFLNKSAQIAEKPAVVVFRLRDTTGLMQAVSRARTFLGQPYDYSFLPNNGKMYCSELVWESYLRSNGGRIFASKPMNFLAQDGTMPAFWQELFERLGEPIPQGVPGTNPHDMAEAPSLKFIHSYYK